MFTRQHLQSHLCTYILTVALAKQVFSYSFRLDNKFEEIEWNNELFARGERLALPTVLLITGALDRSE